MIIIAKHQNIIILNELEKIIVIIIILDQIITILIALG